MPATDILPQVVATNELPLTHPYWNDRETVERHAPNSFSLVRNVNCVAILTEHGQEIATGLTYREAWANAADLFRAQPAPAPIPPKSRATHLRENAALCLLLGIVLYVSLQLWRLILHVVVTFARGNPFAFAMCSCFAALFFAAMYMDGARYR